MSFFKLAIIAIVIIFTFNYFNNQEDSYDDNSNILILPENTKIVAFGDGITLGQRVNSDKNYPFILSDLLQSVVINAGVNGEFTNRGVERLSGILKRYKPQILIICEGANDLKRGKKNDTIKANLAKMIELAKKQKIFVILVGAPYVKYLRYSTADFYEELAHKYNIPIDDTSLEKIANDDSLRIDQFYPNAKGYKILSKSLANIITLNYTPSFSF